MPAVPAECGCGLRIAVFFVGIDEALYFDENGGQDRMVHKSKNFLLNAIPVSVQLINVIQAFPQFNGLLRTDSAVNGILDLINRSLAVFVNERCDIELLTGVSKDVFGNRPGGLSENICEHIIQFKAGDG